MSERPKCNCRGVVAPGAICGYVIVNGVSCGAPAEFRCKHKVVAGSEKPLEQCDCLNECGDDPDINKGKSEPCKQHLAHLYKRERYSRVQHWKSTSADDLKTTLACLVNRDPADAAEDCLYALTRGDVKAKTHRKHIAAALRAASKKLEEAPHV